MRYLVVLLLLLGIQGCAKLGASSAASASGQYAKLYSTKDLITNSCKPVSVVIVDSAGNNSSAEAAETVTLTSDHIQFFSDINCINTIESIDIAQGSGNVGLFVVSTVSGTLPATLTLPSTTSGTNLVFTNTIAAITKQAGDNMEVTVNLQSENNIYVKVTNFDGSPAVLVPVVFDGEYVRIMALTSSNINIFTDNVLTDMTGVASVIVTAPPIVTAFTVTASTSTQSRTIVDTFNLNSIAPVQ